MGTVDDREVYGFFCFEEHGLDDTFVREEFRGTSSFQEVQGDVRFPGWLYSNWIVVLSPVNYVNLFKSRYQSRLYANVYLIILDW